MRIKIHNQKILARTNSSEDVAVRTGQNVHEKDSEGPQVLWSHTLDNLMC